MGVPLYAHLFVVIRHNAEGTTAFACSYHSAHARKLYSPLIPAVFDVSVHGQVEETKEKAKYTAAQLQEGGEKIKRIDQVR